MGSSWQTETGQLALRWSEVGRTVESNPHWMRESAEMRSSYLPPVPDFAGHSPFGGATWFYPDPLASLLHKRPDSF